jgi:transposase
MMGRQSGGQKKLFYSFSLDDHIPSNHLVRGIDHFLDLSELHQHLAPFYIHTSRPSIDPQLLIRRLIVGYCFDIRSERQLCEEVHLNLAYRWFGRLGLEDPVRDHSTFCGKQSYVKTDPWPNCVVGLKLPRCRHIARLPRGCVPIVDTGVRLKRTH